MNIPKHFICFVVDVDFVYPTYSQGIRITLFIPENIDPRPGNKEHYNVVRLLGKFINRAESVRFQDAPIQSVRIGDMYFTRTPEDYLAPSDTHCVYIAPFSWMGPLCLITRERAETYSPSYYTGKLPKPEEIVQECPEDKLEKQKNA